MTFRAIVLGLLCAGFICGVTYFNDQVMRGTQFVGNHMPIPIYGTLILFVLLINPLLYFIWKRLALSGRELAVILVLALVGCSIPGAGLMVTFTTSLSMPFQVEQTTPSWQKPVNPDAWRKGSVLKELPNGMLADINEKNRSQVLDPMLIGGLSTPEKPMPFSAIPWEAWKKPLMFWLPVILIFWLGLLGLSMVVHRQWADHEQLPYPIATFATSLLPNSKQIVSDIFKNKLFWIGLVPVLLIHMNNYACQWFPELIPSPTTLKFDAVKDLVPTIMNGGGWRAIQPTFYFTAIAFAYFLATDVSLALGLGPYIWYFVAGSLAGVGIAAKGGKGDIGSFVQFGAYLAMFLVLIFNGRHYYLNALRGAFCMKTDGLVKSESVWGMRLFLVSMAIFTAYTVILGQLEWQLALLFVGLSTLMFLVMTRIVAETGVYFIQALFNPVMIIITFFGYAALGPKAVLILMMFSIILLIDPKESFMPFIINGFKVLDNNNVKVGKMAIPVIGALILGLAVAVPATLYWQYAKGVNRSYMWAATMVPSMPYAEVVKAETKLDVQGKLLEASQISGWAHFTHIKPDPYSIIALVVGFALVVVFVIGRMRYSKWPVHPVIFLVWATYPAPILAASFMVGWTVKSLVTRFGGGTVYRNLKPLMFGLIAGEMVAGLAMIVISGLFFILTGEPPKILNISP